MNITYNNTTPEDWDTWLATRPVITPSELKVDRYPVAGRNGELIGNYQTRGNAKITFKLHQKRNPNNLEKVVAWLRQPHGKLIMSDDANFYYEPILCKTNSYENKDDIYKRIEVELEVYPFKYRVVPTYNNTTINANTVTTLSVDSDTCEPIYTVTLASGQTSGSFTVNDNTFTVYGNCTIDTRRKKAYDRFGDVLVSGDYDGIKMNYGNNVVETGNVSIQVNSRDGYII